LTGVPVIPLTEQAAGFRARSFYGTQVSENAAKAFVFCVYSDAVVAFPSRKAILCVVYPSFHHYMQSALHSWDLTIPEAIALQQQLRSQIRLAPLETEVRYVGGADISFNKYSETVYAGIVVLELPGLTEVTRSGVVAETRFPYVPGLLSFREIPALLQAWEKLTLKPDVLMVDGHGIAHPRRLGIASHMGLLIDTPTIGCGKSKLVGRYDEPDVEPGSTSVLRDRQEQIGLVLRTKRNVQPLFVSPGHRITFDESIQLVLRCITKYRLPETTRQAHNAVNQLRLQHKDSE